MATYEVRPEGEALHGSFSTSLSPLITIDTGDTVNFKTLDAAWGRSAPTALNMWNLIPDIDGKLEDLGHALCGPVAVRGAQPGMTLGVQINTIRVGKWGWTTTGDANALNWHLGVAGQQTLLTWVLDADRLIGKNQFGQEVALRPFMGIMGMPPGVAGRHSTRPPRFCGGNIDCKELVEGSTLYLPIAVEHALFSVGDGHARQGDGEVGGSAIECPMEEVSLTFHLHKDLHLTTPRAYTPLGWITFGFDENLDKAMYAALNAMLDLIISEYPMQRADALAIASVVVDTHITQIVNGVVGVHAILPHNAISLPKYPSTYAINSGGEAIGHFMADGYCYGDARVASTSAAIDNNQAVQPAPSKVYQTERSGDFNYVFPGLEPEKPYKVRLHFIEMQWDQPNKRIFDVIVNEKLVLRNFDVFVNSGGKNKVIIKEFTVLADKKGVIAIIFLSGQYGSAVSNAIEIYPDR